MFPELKWHCWAIIIINTIKAKGIPVKWLKRMINITFITMMMMSGRRKMWNEEEMNGKQWTTEELWKTTLHKLRAILFLPLDGNNNWKSTLLRILVRKVSLRVLVVGRCRQSPRSLPQQSAFLCSAKPQKYYRRRACGRGYISSSLYYSHYHSFGCRVKWSAV